MVVVGLIAFGVVFALNSAVHSYLILAYAEGDKVAMNVGFYYMANAGGRLAGTMLSGAALPVAGLEACLWASVAFVLGAGPSSCCCRAGMVHDRHAEDDQHDPCDAERRREVAAHRLDHHRHGRHQERPGVTGSTASARARR